MSKKALIILHKSAGESSPIGNNSREFPEISNYMEVVVFHGVSVITAPATSIDLFIQAQDPVSLTWFNVTTDFTWKDREGTTITLTAVTGEGSAVRIATAATPGNSIRGILTTAQEFDYGRLRLRWITNGGGGSVTFTSCVEVKSEE